MYVYLNSQKSELRRIKKLPLVRLENGQHVCAGNQLVFFPPGDAEARKEIAPFLEELPILHSSLLIGNTCNVIETFLKSLGVRMLHPEDLIRESICPKYHQPDGPSVAQNRLHVRYLQRFLSKVPKATLSNLKKEISKTPILLVYGQDQQENRRFLKPCEAYLSQTYTSNTNLETYFSGCSNVWYVDNNYLESNSDRRKWLQFFKSIDAMDTPRIGMENLTVNSQNRQELNERGLEWKNSRNGLTIEDRHFDGLPEVLARISSHKEINLAQVLWHLLVKALPSGESQRDTFFQGIYRWGTYNSQSESFQAMFYRQLQKTAWLPDEQGNFRVPAECFAPTSENHKVLGDSVAYLHPDFDISQDSEAARWLARKLGVHLNANTDSVLNYLQTLSRTGVSVEQIEPLYCFLAQQNSFPSEEFKQKPLTFTFNPEPNWWKLDKVFWEDESPVFGNHRGYLKESYADYEAILRPFFTTLGVSERAAPLDYVHVIRDVTSVELADDAEVRERVKILYGRLWQSLQEGGSLLNSEEWQREWEQTRNGKCWLGKKGSEWGFFSRHELVWNDHHDYIAEIFRNEVPFWAFDDDLLGLAINLGVEGCSQADVKFHPRGDQEEYEIWSLKVRGLHPYIHDFLNSPRLCEAHEEGKSAYVLDSLSVRLVEELETTYTLKEISLTHPNPRQSFLDPTDQKSMLWLALEADESQYAWLIGDALQYYFGDVKEISGFIEDLLTKNQEDVLTRWKQKGLQTDFSIPSTKEDSEEDEESIGESVDGRFPGEPGGEENSGTNDSGVETLTIHEEPETGNEDNDSTENGSEPPTYRSRPSGGGTRPRRSKGINTPSGNRGAGHSSSRSGDTGGETHMEATDTSPHARKEIENIGMEHARRHEKKQGRTPKDVSSENRGYDIYSTSPDGKIRCIEVKARSDHGFVVLTSNEWSTAQQFKDDYFLYVVLNAIPQPELYIIRNPADVVRAVEQIDVRYQVPVSEITEHGIRV